MQKAWRERNPQARIRAAYQALEMNQESVFFLSILSQLCCFDQVTKYILASDHHTVCDLAGNIHNKKICWL